MTREQLDGKFIICRNDDEYRFISYWAKELFDYDINYNPNFPKTIRLKPDPYEPSSRYGQARTGFYMKNSKGFACEKEEECSVLFGNLVKRWSHEHRT